ncbi:zinc knuckle [Trichuris suis]|nr:zinc knuckle [Trichuris suis]
MDLKTQIDKLESASNWSKWKRQIELLLRYHGVLDVVIGRRVALKTLPVGAIAEDVKRHGEEVKCYEKEDTLAQLLLVSSMNEANVELTATSLSAADVWQKLLAVYEQSSGLRMDRLMEEFFSCAMKPLEDVVEYVARLQELFSELNDELEKLANVRLPDLLLMSRILSTLPQEYFEFKTVWESVPVSDRSVNMLVERLRLIEMRLPDKTNGSSAAFAVKADMKKERNKKRGRKCFNCHQNGHFAKCCPMRQNGNKEQVRQLKGGETFCYRVEDRQAFGRIISVLRTVKACASCKRNLSSMKFCTDLTPAV